jgi:hypothetical protein
VLATRRDDGRPLPGECHWPGRVVGNDPNRHPSAHPTTVAEEAVPAAPCGPLART